ncbi:MAG: aminotransferase class V-fold PLP-dependent enzyme [Planctomycetota bacterium]|nr:aminotransferase class V-fold PLP-dependent enzyme [Planctomycetota bacterium]
MTPPHLTVLSDAPSPERPATPPRWLLDPSLTFLNHGSYGALLEPVARAQAAYRERMERDPVRFFKVDLEGLLDGVRESLGAFLNCRPTDLALLPNATVALCTILHAADLRAGDEVVITDHEYQSLLNELDRLREERGVRVVQAAIPFPGTTPRAVVEAVCGAITPRTRLVFVSHVTSGSALVLPVKAIVDECNRRGVDVVVDGAHAPGQVPVDVRGLAPTYYVGSGHKWLSAPKGSAFVYVRPDRQARFRPLALSSRAHKVRPDRSRFLRDFDYFGTTDYSALLSIPQALESMGRLLPGGWPALMHANRTRLLQARTRLCAALGIDEPAPASMVGCMASLPLPEPAADAAGRPTRYDDPLQDALFERHRMVAPVWRVGPKDYRIVRISSQVYVDDADFDRFAGALREELAREHPVRVTA